MWIKQTLCVAVVLISTVAANATAVPNADEPDTVQLVTTFSVVQATQVPGKTLKAGNYSIRIVDHLSDRMIVQIEDAKGNAQTRFLALENPELRTPDRSTGPLTWTKGPGKVTTLRGFALPGGSAIEFVYPKEDAVSIAKVNTSKVPAIDPASEGVTAKNLSKQDLQTVTLWTLLLTKVGSGDASEPAIEAVRYQAPPQKMSAPQSARSSDDSAAMRSASYNSGVTTPVQKAQSVARPVQIAVVKRPVLNALPHTASDQGFIALIGLLALGLGVTIRYARSAASNI